MNIIQNTGRCMYADPDLETFVSACRERIKAMSTWATHEMTHALSIAGDSAINDPEKITTIWKECREKANSKLDEEWFHFKPENEKYKQVVMTSVTSAFHACLRKEREK